MTQNLAQRFEDVVSVERLFLSWELFRRGKRSRADVQLFEYRLEEQIFSLHRELLSGSYRHGAYESFYIEDPKQRHIHKAQVRDRIVHQLVYLELEQIYERGFYQHSYSSRAGKGTQRAILAAENVFRRLSCNYKREVWGLKCDIRRFYDSIQHRVLLRILAEKVYDRQLLGLLEEIVGSFTLTSCMGQGLPIGNLTSQIFTNILLDKLDKFVYRKLRVPAYFRYADDCLLVSAHCDELSEAYRRMRSFLGTELVLEFHPKKVSLRPLDQGVDFLGAVIRPKHRVLRTKTRQRMMRNLQRRFVEAELDETANALLEATKQSYIGLLQHLNAHRLSVKIANIYSRLNP